MALTKGMARRLRIVFPGALYHVINRGNYRQDVFASGGAARAFETVLAEACVRHRWRLHAYGILRNHFHLALETPEPNLSEGMHWLQGTYATRFNRFRSEHGHLFQGRYQSPVVEDMATLARVIHYIHLNPVRAGIVPADQVAAFRWSSLPRLRQSRRPDWLVASGLLTQMNLEDSPAGWETYTQFLRELAADPAEQERQGFSEFSRGWAIGTLGWRRALAESCAQRSLDSRIPAEERQERNRGRWREALQQALVAAGRTIDEVVNASGPARWKLEIAYQLRTKAAVPHRWLATELDFGTAAALRTALWRRGKNHSNG